DIIGWKDRLLSEGKAPGTIEQSLAILKTLYRNALANERLRRKDNPAANIRVGVKRDPRDKVRSYTDAEVVALLEVARGQEAPQLHYLPMILFGCGLRINEAAGLLVEDLKRRGEGAPYVVLQYNDVRP